MMARSIATRLLYTVLVVLTAMSIVFALLHLSGDPADALIPPGSDPADVAALRAKFGLDESLPAAISRLHAPCGARRFRRFLAHGPTGNGAGARTAGRNVAADGDGIS